MLAQLDDGVGRVLARIRAAGIEERTLIVFLSDNGGPTRELTSSNRPLRGEKGQLLEGGVRVPMLLQWKGRVPAGIVEPRMISALELFPTAVAAAGVKPPANLDGVDLLPHLSQLAPEKNREQTAPVAQSASLTPRGAAATEPIRAQHYWRVGAQAALRAGDWKIYRARGEAQWQLFNLDDDVAEARDLSAAQPTRLAELEAAWRALDGQMLEALWTPGGGGRRTRNP